MDLPKVKGSALECMYWAHMDSLGSLSSRLPNARNTLTSTNKSRLTAALEKCATSGVIVCL